MTMYWTGLDYVGMTTAEAAKDLGERFQAVPALQSLRVVLVLEDACTAGMAGTAAIISTTQPATYTALVNSRDKNPTRVPLLTEALSPARVAQLEAARASAAEKPGP